MQRVPVDEPGGLGALQRLLSSLHDAEVSTLVVDYEHRTAELRFQVLVGKPDGASEGEREAECPLRIRVSGLRSCVIDPAWEAPDAAEPPILSGAGFGVPPDIRSSVVPVAAPVQLWFHTSAKGAYLLLSGDSVEFE